jgi:hypothetical protein
LGPAFDSVLDEDADGRLTTHLEMIADGEMDSWSAPSWLTEGDLIFFYLSKRALPRILSALYGAVLLALPEHKAVLDQYGPNDPRFQAWVREAVAALRPGDNEFVDALARARDLARDFEGAIFAGARVTQRPYVERSLTDQPDNDGVPEVRHWRGRVYAPIADLFTLAAPVPASVFTRHAPLSRTGGPTPLHGDAFSGVRDAVAATNRLPRYVREAYAAPGLRGVTRANWRARFVESADAPRFVNEAQFRAYFADFALADLHDPGTPVLEECRCTPTGAGPIADYFVRVGGRWLPVETKLNVRSVPALATQVARYLGVPTVKPLCGTHAGRERRVDGAALALVLDVEGLYLMDADGYVASGPDSPLLVRSDLARLDASEVRARILQHVRTG